MIYKVKQVFKTKGKVTYLSEYIPVHSALIKSLTIVNSNFKYHVVTFPIKMKRETPSSWYTYGLRCSVPSFLSEVNNLHVTGNKEETC